MREKNIDVISYYLQDYSKGSIVKTNCFEIYKDGHVKVNNDYLGRYDILKEKISIYKNGNKMCIYGVDEFKRFVRITFNGTIDSKEKEVLDEDVNVPEKYMKEFKNKYKTYTHTIVLGKNEQNQDTLYLCSNKQIFASIPWKEGEVKEFDQYVTTKSGKIYYIFAGPNANNPWIKVEEIFKGMRGKIVKQKLYNTSGFYIPIFKTTEGKYYTVKPNNEDDFKRYRAQISQDMFASKNIDEVDTSFNIICLDEQPMSIEFTLPDIEDINPFEVETYRWNAKIWIDDMELTVTIDGYDCLKYYSLSEEEIEELRKELAITVHSSEEYWEHVEKIRRAYEKFYSYKDSKN